MLTICPTPIGNLDDTTARQIAALSGADVIACEDTRQTGKLLERLGIGRDEGRPALAPYHDHNEEQAAERLAERALSESVVLVSDAGTPAVSDPGFRLVAACALRGVAIEALPGPSAALVALSGSGLPSDRFLFEGFLPKKSGARRAALARLRAAQVTGIVYESPRRMDALLEAIEEVFGADQAICVARELTKMHEEWSRGSVGEVRAARGERSWRGECVVVIGAGQPAAEPDDAFIREEARRLLDQGASAREARDELAHRFRIAKKRAYAEVLAVRER